MYPLKRYFNMNNKLLIIKAITLLYRLTTLTDKLERPIQLLIDVTNAVKTPDMDLTVDRETRMMFMLQLKLAIQSMTYYNVYRLSVNLIQFYLKLFVTISY